MKDLDRILYVFKKVRLREDDVVSCTIYNAKTKQVIVEWDYLPSDDEVKGTIRLTKDIFGKEAVEDMWCQVLTSIGGQYDIRGEIYQYMCRRVER